MARAHTEKARLQADNDQFLLIRMASARARQLQKGARPLTENVANTYTVTALREIEEGKYTQAHYFGTEKVEGLKEETTEEEQDEYQLTQSERNPE